LFKIDFITIKATTFNMKAALKKVWS